MNRQKSSKPCRISINSIPETCRSADFAWTIPVSQPRLVNRDYHQTDHLGSRHPPADGQSSKLTNRCWAMSGATCDSSRAGSLNRLHTTGRFPIGPAGISPKLTVGSRFHGILRQPFANPDVIDPGPESLTRCSGAAGAERGLRRERVGRLTGLDGETGGIPGEPGIVRGRNVADGPAAEIG